MPLRTQARHHARSIPQLLVTMSSHAHEVQLLSGEALFEVQHGRTPFRVVIGDVLVEDLGTEFTVKRHDSGIQIAVTEGLVQLRCDCTQLAAQMIGGISRPISSLRLDHPSILTTARAGEQVDLSREDAVIQIRRTALAPEQIKDIAVRREGRFDFAGETLAEVVKEFNRYNRRQFVVSDPKIERLRIGGSFQIHGVVELIQALHDTFGIAAESFAAPNVNPDVIRLVRNDRCCTKAPHQ
jgi:transmembrane sensor